MRWLDRLFGAAEEINGANRCPTYLYRWHIWNTRRLKVYLHHFVGDDWALDLHDHPKRFISIGLKGWYFEDRPSGSGTIRRKYQAPWFRSFPAQHIHRITVPSKSCWTLVIVLKTVREWGFWHDRKFVPWREYVDGPLGDEMKACGD